MNPFEQLTGKLDVYIAPYGTAIPDVNATPNGDWTRLGATEGDQELENKGRLNFYRDNDHQGPVKADRPEEDVVALFTVVGLTMEKQAIILHDEANVTEDVGPPATKEIPLKRGEIPVEYALLMRGTSYSPYGDFPGQYVVPRGVFDGEPKRAAGKGKRAALACEFYALEDDAQTNPKNSLGWMVVQIS